MMNDNTSRPIMICIHAMFHPEIFSAKEVNFAKPHVQFLADICRRSCLLLPAPVLLETFMSNNRLFLNHEFYSSTVLNSVTLILPPGNVTLFYKPLTVLVNNFDIAAWIRVPVK